MKSFNDLTKILYNGYLGTVSNLLDMLSTKDIDAIATYSFNEIETNFIMSNATIFSVPYPNSNGYINIISLEGQIFKLLNKDTDVKESDTTDAK